MILGRNENIEIFKDTEKLVKNNETIKASVKASTNKQKIILEDDTIDLEKKEKKSAPARVIVSQKRTFEAASEYKGMKTVVHNFASATNPGGGVVRGANAQEECLCRCSGLYFNLNILYQNSSSVDWKYRIILLTKSGKGGRA